MNGVILNIHTHRKNIKPITPPHLFLPHKIPHPPPQNGNTRPSQPPSGPPPKKTPPHRVMSVRLALISSRGVMGDTAMSLSTARLAASASWILSGYEVTHTLNQPARRRSYVVIWWVWVGGDGGEGSVSEEKHGIGLRVCLHESVVHTHTPKPREPTLHARPQADAHTQSL